MNTVYLLFLNKNLNKNEISHFAKTLVKQKAAKILNTTPEKLEFKTSENGKPYIENYSDFNFNISHTSGAIAIAISDSPVGIDIEKIRKADFRVAKRFFTEKENEYIKAQNSDTRFFEIWTKKEAYIKKNGLTLGSIRNSDTAGIYTFINNSYVISVCHDSPEQAEIIYEYIN